MKLAGDMSPAYWTANALFCFQGSFTAYAQTFAHLGFPGRLKEWPSPAAAAELKGLLHGIPL